MSEMVLEKHGLGLKNLLHKFGEQVKTWQEKQYLKLEELDQLFGEN